VRSISPSPTVQSSSHNWGLLNTDSMTASGMSSRALPCYHAYSSGTEASIGGRAKSLASFLRTARFSHNSRFRLWGMGEPCP